MELKETLLVREIIDPDRQVTLRFLQDLVETVEQEIAVYHKRSWQWMNTKHIGDNVFVARFHKRPFVVYDLDLVWLSRGLSIYQEYDEQTDSLQSYLYKFPKDDDLLDEVNTLLEHYHAWVAVRQKNNFIVLEWSLQYIDTDQMLVELSHGWYKAILSFLFGMSLWYGTFASEDELLHGCDIYLPMHWSVTRYEHVFTKLSTMLTYHGMYHFVELTEQHHGQQIRFSLSDWEIMQQFAHRLSIEEWVDLEASKKKTTLAMKESLLDWLRPQLHGKQLLDQIEYSVLKMLKK